MFQLKNAGSWSSIATSNSSHNMSRKPAAVNSFEHFRKQAKEKEERVCFKLVIADAVDHYHTYSMI